ncbi:FAD dependent oxidoreductase [Teratosphaeria nubilosa]|uniref:FAD dependent oxidoreductase n=1 Tax=Teratosphaeria nubilosa TaxID=161662 RepID=A0A6G1LFT2_9PEZI|nr:FAD dependent oxidoreductase [Teratosphaeria nubilosa]
MNERARIRPGIPSSHPTISYWQDPPADIADLRSTPELPPTAEYVVVGSGISGSSIAYNLLCKRPGSSVCLLEARQACSGATGRNGGHTKAASYRTFLDHERELGVEEAVKIARLEYANIIATHAFAKENKIDCASTICNTVDIVYSQAQLELGCKAIARMREVMGEDDPASQYTIWSAGEARKRFRTPDALGAFEYLAGSLSAYDFTIGLLKLSLAKGLNVQTHTPAHSITRRDVDGKVKWTVQTQRGSITTTNLILATNGYTAHLLPQTQGVIVPLRGQVVAQRPGRGLPQKGLEHTYSFIHEIGYEYMITRPPSSRNEGDMVIGGGMWTLPNDGASEYGGTDDSVLEPTIAAFLRKCTSGYFGDDWGRDHPDGRIKTEWSGIMGASADGLPYVGPVPTLPGLWLSASFNGHGMVWCFKAAEAVVELMAGTREAREAVQHWFPASAIITEARLKCKFSGRKDLWAPGEGAFGERGRL